MSEKRFLSPGTMSPPFGYSHIVDAAASRVIFISGQVPLNTDGDLVGKGDFEAQARQVFANLSAALEAAGAGWSDVVKLNYFLTDIGELGTVRAIRDEYVDTERPPASTLVQVSALFSPEAMVEIEAVAIKG